MLRLRPGSPPVPRIADRSCCAICCLRTGATAAAAAVAVPIQCRPRVLGGSGPFGQSYRRGTLEVSSKYVLRLLWRRWSTPEWIVTVAPLPNWLALLVSTCDRPAGRVDPACADVVV